MRWFLSLGVLTLLAGFSLYYPPSAAADLAGAPGLVKPEIAEVTSSASESSTVNYPAGGGAVPEASFSGLSKVVLTPASPFYFLKTVWEMGRWLLARSPENKIFLALDFAESRLAEALQEARSNNLSVVERLFKRREELLKKATAQLSKLSESDPRKDEIRRRIYQQLTLGNQVLSAIRGALSDEDKRKVRVENILAWRSEWVAKLEKSLGPPPSAPEAEPQTTIPVPPPKPATAAGMRRGGSVFPRPLLNLFGSGRTILSPLATPEGN